MVCEQAIGVAVSTLPIPPGPIKLKAPAEIDLCSDLKVMAEAPSPRALTFFWACSNDDSLNFFLKGVTTGLLALGPGTPEMPTPDKVYVITVRVTDFLGVSSEISFQMLTSYNPKNAILVRGEAVFSKCPGGEQPLLFFWSELSAPIGNPFPPDMLAGGGAQLYIPGSTLRHNSVYTVLVRVEALLDVKVDASPLLALISGGSAIKVSEDAAIEIDASGSRDLGEPASGPQELSYSWACTSGGTQCRDASNSLVSFTTSATATVSANTFFPSDVPYVLTVVIRKDSREASASVSVTVVAGAVPALSIVHSIDVLDGFSGMYGSCP
ncbi:REJ domain-containing protein [Baffinella frigidus]|nr:REJ domain-containing protein [Cryptophyta sp. CCMP2293]